MKSRKTALIVCLSVVIFGCSQSNIVELPLTVHNAPSPVDTWSVALYAVSGNENDPWKSTYPEIAKFPEGLTGIKYGYIETNLYQAAYQDYLLGNITREMYEEWRRHDTLTLSKTPVRTKIAFVWGNDSDGVLKIAVDVNGNLDLSDDRLFEALEGTVLFSSTNKDSLIRVHAFDVSYEAFVHEQIAPAIVPLFIYYNSQINMFFSMFCQYATAQYKGEQLVIAQFKSDLSYKSIQLALYSGERVKEEDTYRNNEYIEIKGDFFRIIGVNTNKQTLVLEKTKMRTAQVGQHAGFFEAEDFATKAPVSLERLKGKYVLLDFWMTSCGPCIQEFPHLKELYDKTDRTKFEIVGIAAHSTPANIKRTVELHGIAWSQVLSDETNQLVEKYGISGYPSTFLIDPEGVIIAKDLRGKELEEKVLSLLEK
jgi:peroxiredoxin